MDDADDDNRILHTVVSVDGAILTDDYLTIATCWQFRNDSTTLGIEAKMLHAGANSGHGYRGVPRRVTGNPLVHVPKIPSGFGRPGYSSHSSISRSISSSEMSPCSSMAV